jgi:hypothetical protein
MAREREVGEQKAHLILPDIGLSEAEIAKLKERFQNQIHEAMRASEPGGGNVTVTVPVLQIHF